MTKRVAKKVLRKDCDGVWSVMCFYKKVPKKLWRRAANKWRQELNLHRGNKWCPYVNHR